MNSSPNAVSAYTQMVFIQLSEELLANGMRYVPMELGLRIGDVGSATA